MCCVCVCFVFQPDEGKTQIQQFLFCCALWPATCLVHLPWPDPLKCACVSVCVCGYVHVHALFVPVAAMMCLPVCQDVHRFVPWCALVNVSCVAAPGKCISSVIGVITRSTLCAFNNDFAYTLCLCVRVCQHVCVRICESAGVCLCACVCMRKKHLSISADLVWLTYLFCYYL